MRRLISLALFLTLLSLPSGAQWSTTPPTPGVDDVTGVPLGYIGKRYDDDEEAQFGTSRDFRIYHDGTDNFLEGILDGARMVLQGNNLSTVMTTMVEADPDAEVGFYSAGTKVFETESDGLDMLTNPISNVADPTDDQDAATKIWTETEIAISGGGKLPTDWEFDSITNSTLGYNSTAWIDLINPMVEGTEYLIVWWSSLAGEFTIAQSDVSIVELGVDGDLGDTDGNSNVYTGTNAQTTQETKIFVDLNAAVTNPTSWQAIRFIAAEFDGYTNGGHISHLTTAEPTCGVRINNSQIEGRDTDPDDDCAFGIWTR